MLEEEEEEEEEEGVQFYPIMTSFPLVVLLSLCIKEVGGWVGGWLGCIIHYGKKNKKKQKKKKKKKKKKKGTVSTKNARVVCQEWVIFFLFQHSCLDT